MFYSNPELQDIDQEIESIKMDLQSNSSSILMKPHDMKAKIESYLHMINQIEQRLNFFKKSNVDTQAYKKIADVERKIAILKNQIELDQKMLKKDVIS